MGKREQWDSRRSLERHRRMVHAARQGRQAWWPSRIRSANLWNDTIGCDPPGTLQKLRAFSLKSSILTGNLVGTGMLNAASIESLARF
jgi:hypothetical protein